MAINKVQYGQTVIIDLTSDTVTTDKLLYGVTAHDRTGAIITGTATASGAISDTVVALAGGGDHHIITGIDLSSDTVAADKLLSGYTAHNSSGTAITGTFEAEMYATHDGNGTTTLHLTGVS